MLSYGISQNELIYSRSCKKLSHATSNDFSLIAVGLIIHYLRKLSVTTLTLTVP